MSLCDLQCSLSATLGIALMSRVPGPCGCKQLWPWSCLQLHACDAAWRSYSTVAEGEGVHAGKWCFWSKDERILTRQVNYWGMPIGSLA